MERLDFDTAIARAVEKNPSVAIAATNILRSEAIVQQVRAGTLPRVNANATNTTLDSGRSFGDQTVQPQNQSLFALSASAPLSAVQWAAKAQAMDQIEVAKLSTADVRKQVAVAAASAYLSVITEARQVEITQRALETARAQSDFNRRRREGGIGSRLNELRSDQVVSSDEALLETALIRVRRAQEALGVLLGANAPVDVVGEPAFEIPPEAPEADWMAIRPDVQLFTATQRAAERVVQDSAKDWWPTGAVSFDPQLLAPSGIFQPSRTWRLTFSLAQPIYDGGQRRGAKLARQADVTNAERQLERLQIQARSEVRLARAELAAYERALVSARRAADQSNEVLKITIVAFDAGASTNIEVIDAQRSARDLETAVGVIEDGVRQSRLDLLVALGRFPR